MNKLLLLSLSLIALPAFGDPYKKIDVTHLEKACICVEIDEPFEICASKGTWPFHWWINKFSEGLEINGLRVENDAKVWTIVPQELGTFKIVLGNKTRDAGICDVYYETIIKEIKITVKPRAPRYHPEFPDNNHIRPM